MKITRVNVNKYLEENNLTRDHLSKKICFSYSMLNRVLDYDAPISKNLMDKLNEYFKKEEA